eukprot:350258-Chlamydomonas_euryale.AAC.3
MGKTERKQEGALVVWCGQAGAAGRGFGGVVWTGGCSRKGGWWCGVDRRVQQQGGFGGVVWIGGCSSKGLWWCGVDRRVQQQGALVVWCGQAGAAGRGFGGVVWIGGRRTTDLRDGNTHAPHGSTSFHASEAHIRVAAEACCMTRTIHAV